MFARLVLIKRKFRARARNSVPRASLPWRDSLLPLRPPILLLVLVSRDIFLERDYNNCSLLLTWNYTVASSGIIEEEYIYIYIYIALYRYIRREGNAIYVIYMCDVKEKKREIRLRKPTFAVASEFLPTLRAECRRGSTNQPPKCTQQHHYHFTARMFHFRERVPRYYFLFRVSLTESLPFGIANVPATGAKGNGDVDHISVSL